VMVLVMSVTSVHMDLNGHSTTVGFVLRYATVASEPTGGTDYAVRIRRAAPPG
jgi:hypothetical protein